MATIKVSGLSKAFGIEELFNNVSFEIKRGERVGFVPLASLNAPASTTHLTAHVTEDKINMRDRASKEGNIIGRARLGERLRVADYGVDWTCVVTPDGKRGYMMTSYLEFE